MDADAAAGGRPKSSERLTKPEKDEVILGDSLSEKKQRKPGRTGSGKMILPQMPKVPKVPVALPSALTRTGQQDPHPKAEHPSAFPADAFSPPEQPTRRGSKSESRSKDKRGEEKREEDLDQIDVQALSRQSNSPEAWGMPKELTAEESWLLKEVWARRLRTDFSEPVTPRLFTAEEVAQAATILAKRWRHQTRMRRLGMILAACILIGPALFAFLYAAAIAGSPSQVDDTGVMRKVSTGHPVKLGTVLKAAPLGDLWGMPVDQLRQLEAVVLREDRGKPGEMVMKVLHLHRSPGGEVVLHFGQNDTMVVGSPPGSVRMRWGYLSPAHEEVLEVEYVDSSRSSHALFQVMAVSDVG